MASLRRVAALALVLAACTAPEPPPAVPTPAPPPPVLFVWPTFPDPPATPLPGPAVDGLQAVLDHAVEIDSHLPDSTAGAAGLTAAVVTDRGTWTGAAGVDARGAPLTATSTSGIADVTNTVVAAEVVRLADAQRISLDAPLSTYDAEPSHRASVRRYLGMQSGAAGPVYTEEDYTQLERAVERVTGKTLADSVHADLAGAPVPNADALGVARWGYDLYGARVLPPEDVAAMTAPSSPGQIAEGFRYGLGTMLFSQTLGLGDTFGHIGRAPGALSILAVVPGRHIAVAVLIADDGKNVTDPVQEIFAVLDEHLT